jgi:hypothetical protein
MITNGKHSYCWNNEKKEQNLFIKDNIYLII